MSEVRLAAEQRTEFGKGAARRTRRAGRIPAVLYGHGSEPKHLSLPALEFARVVREHGNNAVLTLDLGPETEMALTKTVTTHPLKNYIEHVDLLLVKRGEKVTVEIPVHVVGEAANGTLVNQDLTTIQLEVEAMDIPEAVEVSIADAPVGTQIHASDVPLPRGAVLITDANAMVVAVNASPTAAQMEADIDVEGAGVVEEPKNDTEG